MRYASLDILRTLAIFVMVLVHFGENLAGDTIPLAGFGAPLFALLNGVGYRLWLRGQQRRGTSKEQISKVSIRRGLFVIGVGFAFNLFVWLPEGTYNWDVLTLIGVALILLNVMRRLPLSISLLVAGIAVVMSPLLGAMADYEAYWVNGFYDPDLILSDVLIGFLVTGYFPFFPWISFPLVGFVAGDYLFGDTADAERPGRRTAGVGAALLAASLLALAARPYLPDLITHYVLLGWWMYPATIVYVGGALGGALVLLGILHERVDLAPNAARHAKALGVASLFSRYSFTIYIVHHIVHVWPLWIYAIAMGHEDPTYYWMKAMPLATALALAPVFMVVCYMALRAIPPGRRIGVESWMRWLCD